MTDLLLAFAELPANDAAALVLGAGVVMALLTMGAGLAIEAALKARAKRARRWCNSPSAKRLRAKREADRARLAHDCRPLMIRW